MALASKPRSVDDVLEFPPSHDPVLLSNKYITAATTSDSMFVYCLPLLTCPTAG